MEPLLICSTALALGSVHAFETDHMAAVTAFVLRRPDRRSALDYCVRWALGHGAALVVAGAILIALGIPDIDSATSWAERCVGLALILLGAWTVAGARKLHAHRHVHDDGTVHVHLHSHALSEDHDHRHGATAMGLLHGLAGTAPAVALIPLATFSSIPLAIAYLALFAVGTAAGMGVFGLLAGTLAGQAALRSERVARIVTTCAGLATTTVGIFWLLR
jgi:sulfite exporter TauE/SafE